MEKDRAVAWAADVVAVWAVAWVVEAVVVKGPVERGGDGWAVPLRPGPKVSASVPNAAEKNPISGGYPAISSAALSAELP